MAGYMLASPDKAYSFFLTKTAFFLPVGPQFADNQARNAREENMASLDKWACSLIVGWSVCIEGCSGVRLAPSVAMPPRLTVPPAPLSAAATVSPAARPITTEHTLGHTAAVSVEPIRFAVATSTQTEIQSSLRLRPHDDEHRLIPAAAELPPDPSRQADAPQPSLPSPMRLDDIIQTTLWADPQLRAAFEAIRQSQGDAWTAALPPNPQLFITQTLLPLTRAFTPDKQGGPPQLDVGVRYPIDWFVFGKRAAAMLHAQWGVRIAAEEFAERVRQRVRDATLAYYDLLEAKALVELARQNVDNLRQVEAITERAVKDGGRPLVDLNRIRLDRLRAEQELRDAENRRVAAAAVLRSFLGQQGVDPAFDVAGSLDEVGLASPPETNQAFDLAAQERPDVLARQWRVQQARANQLLQYRNAYPQLTPQLGYTRQFQERSIGFPDASSYGFGMEASLPLFDRNQGNRLRAAAELAQAEYEYQASLVGLRAEIEQLAQGVRTASANVQSIAEEQLKLAAAVRDSIIKAYEAGGRSLVEVLDAQRNYRETYRLYIVSRANLARAKTQFNAAVNRRVLP